jgi:uncharacterized protein YidB (DUF937 family)
MLNAWIGHGPNLPISTRALRRVLGDERLKGLGTLVGPPSDVFLVRFTRLLPAAVHRMTPDGEE